MLTTLPWVARDLAERAPAELDRTLANIEFYMRLEWKNAYLFTVEFARDS